MSRLSPALEVTKAAVSREIAGVVVPWEVQDFASDFAIFEKQGGIFDLGSWQVVAVRGPDARDFLHRMTTWDAKRSAAGRADRGAVLNGRAHAVAMGWFLPDGNDVLLVFPGPQGTAAAEHLEAMHFSENLTVTVEPWAVFVAAEAGMPQPQPAQQLLRESSRWQWNDDTQPFYWTLVPAAEATAWLAAATPPLVGGRVFHYLRLCAGIPEVGRELTGTSIVLEGNFHTPIARDKGCYPGQEVIERIFTYGQVSRRLYPVRWDAVRDLSAGLRLLASEGADTTKPLEATLVAAERNPGGQGGVGLALLPRAAFDYAGSWLAQMPEGDTVTVRRR